MTQKLLAVLVSVEPLINVECSSKVLEHLKSDEKIARMQQPCFLVIQENKDGIFLYRYDAKGECIGDTWHLNIEDAKNQARHEYGNAVQEWEAVKPEADDVVSLGLARIKEAAN
jgi:transposase